MKLSAIHTAILLSTLPTTMAFAGGLDRSGQSIAAFLQPGNYAEASLSVLDADVQGQSTINPGEKITDMAESYYFPSAAIKVQATDKISLGLLYDQPYGADAQYATAAGTFGNGQEGTSVEVRTHNLTALIGYQPNENWNIYAGPVYQTVEADIALRGAAYSVLNGYNIHVEREPAFGWIAGAAYQIPEIALKASLTYRSEVTHKAKTNETSNLPAYAMINPAFAALGKIDGDVKAITPQSLNFDFQTGIAANTIAFANVRWVHWDNFVVSPVLLGYVGQNLIEYSDDQWSANVGVGRKFTPKWAANMSVGWDSGAGNPVTTLGPTEGYWNVGVGGQYSPAENYFIQAGLKYFWLGDAQAQTGNAIKGNFTSNEAIGYGLKMGYRF